MKIYEVHTGFFRCKYITPLKTEKTCFLTGSVHNTLINRFFTKPREKEDKNVKIIHALGVILKEVNLLTAFPTVLRLAVL